MNVNKMCIIEIFYIYLTIISIFKCLYPKFYLSICKLLPYLCQNLQFIHLILQNSHFNKLLSQIEKELVFCISNACKKETRYIILYSLFIVLILENTSTRNRSDEI